MRSRLCGVLLSAFLLAAPEWAQAQATQMTATTTVAAPVFASRDDSQAPLRVAREGSVLLLLDVNGDWCHVEFQDPEFGRREGYVQTKYVRINVSAPGATGQGSVASRPAVTQPPASEQRGDVAFGYVFMREEGLSLPLGIAGSDAWRVHPNVDVVIESQYVHGTIDLLVADVSENIWTALVLLCQIRRSISFANRFDHFFMLLRRAPFRYVAPQCSIARRPRGCAGC